MDHKQSINRRHFLKATVLTLVASGIPTVGSARDVSRLERGLAALEKASGGRLGVALLETGQHNVFGHRVNERFGMCSTFKLALAGLILREVQDGYLELDAPVSYSAIDMVPHAPVTSRFLEQGQMTVGALAEAAQTTSDNVAANLLLNLIDGPAGFTRRLRDLGDETTRLDRYEPDMNLVPHGEIRDTTTPVASATTVNTMLFGDFLNAVNRQQLADWTRQTRTGRRRLRAGFPATWVSGDKTGTGMDETMPTKYNDIAIVWPNNPIPGFVLATFYDDDGKQGVFRREDEKVLKSAGQLAAEYYGY